MGTIQELPTLDRPRERALRYGLSSLSDTELLSLLISKGYQGNNALELASDLINNFNGLSNLSKASIPELKKIKGIKDVKAINLLAIFEIHNRLLIKEVEANQNVATIEYLVEKYRTNLVSSHQENLILIILNKNHKIYERTERNKNRKEPHGSLRR